MTPGVHHRLERRDHIRIKLPGADGGVVRSHHERWNGSGYPDRLRGEDIPILARIVAACDTYDALTSEKPYRHAVTHTQALEELHAAVSTGQLDANVVTALETVVNPRGQNRVESGR